MKKLLLILMVCGLFGVQSFAQNSFSTYYYAKPSSSGLTLVDAKSANYADTAQAQTTASMTWQAGDRFFVIGLSEDTSQGFVGVPTATGLTFTLVQINSTANDCWVGLWEATAGGSGSSAITISYVDAFARYGGITAFQFRGCSGRGTPQTIANSSAKTISLTRTVANSQVICGLADWNAVADGDIDATPSGTVQVENANVNAGFFVLNYPDQGGTGTTSYGIQNHTGTVDMAGIVVEIKP